MENELYILEVLFGGVKIVDTEDWPIEITSNYFNSFIPSSYHDDAKVHLLQTCGAIRAISIISRHQIVKNKIFFDPYPEMVKTLSLIGGSAHDKIWGRYSRLPDSEEFSRLPKKLEKQIMALLNILWVTKRWYQTRQNSSGPQTAKLPRPCPNLAVCPNCFAENNQRNFVEPKIQDLVQECNR